MLDQDTQNVNTPNETNEEVCKVYTLGDILPEWNKAAERLNEARRTGRPLGPVSGIYTIDREMCGAFPPGMHILHGDPGAGKTAFALQIACTCECPAVYVTCEMSPLELMRRIAARASNTYLGKFKTGELPVEEMRLLGEIARDSAPALAILDGTKGFIKPELIKEIAIRLKQDRESEYIFIAIDSIHSWSDSFAAQSEYDALSKAIRSIQKIASDLQCPVLGIAERNRISQNKGGQNAAAGSRKFEYGGETVLDLSREDQANAFGEMPVTLQFAKNRHNTPGKKVKLSFNGALQRFKEV